MGLAEDQVLATKEDSLPRLGWRRGLLEIALIGVLYVFYTASRMFASNDLIPAKARAARLEDIEDVLGIAWEATINQWFALEKPIAVFGSYWYATTHYIVTAAVLVWLYRLGSRAYLPARRALVVATLLALGVYLLAPTAPPRLVGGYVDILNLTSADGWWGGDASAPKGLGDLTNQLAAFPSLHAGWALWVAIAVQRHGRWRPMRIAGWCYAATTGLVIVGTGNHWVLDVFTGWLVVVIGFVAVRKMPVGRAPAVPAPSRS